MQERHDCKSYRYYKDETGGRIVANLREKKGLDSNAYFEEERTDYPHGNAAVL